MSIRFDSDSRIFVLETAHTSYHMKVDALGHLLHLYYGKTIGTGDLMQLYIADGIREVDGVGGIRLE